MPMEFVLFGLLAVLLIFMIFNTRKRTRQMKAEQEEKATKTVPGAKVLLQGGIYGTIVAFDPDDLDALALVEIAPGTVIGCTARRSSASSSRRTLSLRRPWTAWMTASSTSPPPRRRRRRRPAPVSNGTPTTSKTAAVVAARIIVLPES